MKFTCDDVRKYGLTPYAVYGGFVASFKIKSDDETAYDIELLPSILAQAQSRIASS